MNDRAYGQLGLGQGSLYGAERFPVAGKLSNLPSSRAGKSLLQQLFERKRSLYASNPASGFALHPGKDYVNINNSLYSIAGRKLSGEESQRAIENKFSQKVGGESAMNYVEKVASAAEIAEVGQSAALFSYGFLMKMAEAGISEAVALASLAEAIDFAYPKLNSVIERASVEEFDKYVSKAASYWRPAPNSRLSYELMQAAEAASSARFLLKKADLFGFSEEKKPGVLGWLKDKIVSGYESAKDLLGKGIGLAGSALGSGYNWIKDKSLKFYGWLKNLFSKLKNWVVGEKKPEQFSDEDLEEGDIGELLLRGTGTAKMKGKSSDQEEKSGSFVEIPAGSARERARAMLASLESNYLKANFS